MNIGIHDRMLDGTTLYGETIDRIRKHCSHRSVYLAFSGGKDSQVCYHLLQEAGISFHAEYSVTRFEPPELIQFIREHYPTIPFRRAYKKPLLEEITVRGLPSLFVRWCCTPKHVGASMGYDLLVLGIRAAESRRRASRWSVHGIKEDGTHYLCPIIDWSDDNVWEYLTERKLKTCVLYKEGFTRIGCVCCPLAPKHMERDIARYPETAAILRKGADAYVDRLHKMGFITARGTPCSDWCQSDNPEQEYWDRWVASGQTAKSLVDLKLKHDRTDELELW